MARAHNQYRRKAPWLVNGDDYATFLRIASIFKELPPPRPGRYDKGQGPWQRMAVHFGCSPKALRDWAAGQGITWEELKDAG